MTAWRLERGAIAQRDGRTRFSVWAPSAAEVSLRFPGSAGAEHPLKPAGGGVFELITDQAPAGTDYLYRLDGRRECPDPVSRHQPHGVHGPSRVVDPGTYRWSDQAWRGLEARELILYELHVGTFTPAATFTGIIERLAALRELGVTAIELMPIAEFPGTRNWGYDGVHLYAPHSAYGGPDGLRRLVDAAHAAGLGVILDVVYNHLGPEGNYLGHFGPYFTDQHHTPWGHAVNYDGPSSDEVRRYVVDNALYWVTEYHLDGLRLDAVHAIIDLSAEHLLAEVTTAVHRQGDVLGRRLLVTAESALNDPRVVRPRACGGYGLDAQWNDDLHHAIHSYLTAERSGYYSDFGDFDHLVKALRDRFVLDGVHSAFRRRRHGLPAVDVPADRFVVFAQNHDQVGNRATGDRLTTLLPFEQVKLAAALYLLSPYVPLLFMGEEYGETNPFLYFVSHGDPDLVEAVRKGRRKEFEDFGWQGEVPDPQAEDTFNRSRLSWSWEEDRVRRATRLLYRDLIALRRREPALQPGAASVSVAAEGAARWITVTLERSADSTILIAFNLQERPVVIGASAGSDWRLSLSTSDARYGGPGVPEQNLEGGFRLAPWSAACYRSAA